MRLPGGAVWPAMNAATGFFMCAFTKRGGLLLGGAADLADHQDGLGLRVALEQLQAVDEVVPLTGSPPMPTQVDWPRPSAVSWCAAS